MNELEIKLKSYIIAKDNKLALINKYRSMIAKHPNAFTHNRRRSEKIIKEQRLFNSKIRKIAELRKSIIDAQKYEPSKPNYFSLNEKYIVSKEKEIKRLTTLINKKPEDKRNSIRNKKIKNANRLINSKKRNIYPIKSKTIRNLDIYNNQIRNISKGYNKIKEEKDKAAFNRSQKGMDKADEKLRVLNKKIKNIIKAKPSIKNVKLKYAVRNIHKFRHTGRLTHEVIFSAENVDTLEEFAEVIYDTANKLSKSSLLINVNVRTHTNKKDIGFRYVSYRLNDLKSSSELYRVMFDGKLPEYYQYTRQTSDYNTEHDSLSYDRTWFIIFYQTTTAASRGKDLKVDQIVDLDPKYNGIDFASIANDDNCVLRILSKVTKINTPYHQVRKELKLNETGGINICDKFTRYLLCGYYKVGIDVVNKHQGCGDKCCSMHYNSKNIIKQDPENQNESCNAATLYIGNGKSGFKNPQIQIHIKDNHAYLVVSKKRITGRIKKNNKRQFTGSDFIFYDIEAVYDYTNDEYVVFSISASHKEESKFWLGYDSMKKFYDWLVEKTKDPETKFFVYGFNNSAFDDYKLLEHLLCNENIKPNIFTFSNRLFLTWNNICTRDIFKMIPPQSLDRFCKNFKINNAKKADHDFKFEELNLYYNNKGPEAFMKYLKDVHYKEMEIYNIYDVLSIQEGFHMLRKFLTNGSIKHLFDEGDFEESMTLGMFANKGFKKSWVGNIKPCTTYANYNEWYENRQAARAGISFSIKKIFKADIPDELRFLIDVVSLYPYIMLHLLNYYPYGPYTKTDKFVPGFIGNYLCTDIDQRILGKNLNIVAVKVFKGNDKIGVYDYITKKIIPEAWVNSIDMDQLTKYGCTFKVKRGYYWTKSASGKKIFGPYLDLFRIIKQQQDVYKASKDSRYNPGLREFAKMMMNIISGKIIQRFAYEAVNELFMLGDQEKEKKFYRKYKDVVVSTYNNQYMILKGKKDLKTLYKNKPIKDDTQMLGICTYAYARKHMYDFSIYKCDPAIIETDSSCINIKKHAERLYKEMTTDIDGQPMPVLFAPSKEQPFKKFGQFEIEENNISLVLTPGKKSYFMVSEKPNGDKKTKRRFKGLSKKWLNCPAEFIELKKTLSSYKFTELCEKYYLDNPNETNEYGDYDIGNDSMTCLSRANYEKIMNGETIYILQRLITRKVHQSFKKVGNKIFHLGLEYRIKKAKLNL